LDLVVMLAQVLSVPTAEIQLALAKLPWVVVAALLEVLDHLEDPEEAQLRDLIQPHHTMVELEPLAKELPEEII
jgi:hypothetical protein